MNDPAVRGQALTAWGSNGSYLVQQPAYSCPTWVPRVAVLARGCRTNLHHVFDRMDLVVPVNSVIYPGPDHADNGCGGIGSRSRRIESDRQRTRPRARGRRIGLVCLVVLGNIDAKQGQQERKKRPKQGNCIRYRRKCGERLLNDKSGYGEPKQGLEPVLEFVYSRTLHFTMQNRACNRRRRGGPGAL